MIKTCRSELAREALESAAFIQHARVIVKGLSGSIDQRFTGVRMVTNSSAAVG